MTDKDKECRMAIQQWRDSLSPEHCRHFTAWQIAEQAFQAGAAWQQSRLLDDSHLAAENAELRAEIDEQCRIIGMSGERELRHLAEIERLRKLLGEVEKLIQSLDEATQWTGRAGDYVDEIKAKIRAELSGENRGGE